MPNEGKCTILSGLFFIWHLEFGIWHSLYSLTSFTNPPAFFASHDVFRCAIFKNDSPSNRPNFPVWAIGTTASAINASIISHGIASTSAWLSRTTSS